MTKNPIRLVRNPNSPEAVQARLDGYEDPTIPEQLHIIDDNDASRIFIDLTETIVRQKVGYIYLGGSKFNKKFVKSSLSVDSEGRAILTNYYTDTVNRQWVIIKDYLDRPRSGDPDLDGPFHHPLSTYPAGTFGGYFSGAPGENWRNQGRSVDKIREAQKRIFSDQEVEGDQTKHLPEDHYDDEFTGED